ncbi:Alpha/Beta hydrolase protein [Halteromyces radiatus]|uniref:Alpha/Beta hydrolase protein n=1 Tax=Halteromyces radiatus TaxID=101107 RepID=UPI002220E8AE|nr:Alpha/Beta hydrolase protein [Halteromyces radiatus]KAI8093525.1 Alpha/Beta hydrolase protein [Halteromyces radiatus]
MTNYMLKFSLPPWLSYILSITGIASVAGAFLLYLYQCELIYPSSFPDGSRTEVAKPSDFGMSYTEETLITKDKVKLRCYVITLEDVDEAKRAPTILYFHANAGNMGHRLPVAKIFNQKFRTNVVMLSYRGYGFSEGKANEKGLQVDSQTLLDFVKEHPILKNTKFVAYGQSIGGAVAIDLVSRNEDAFSGLMVENTFLSIPKLIPSVFPMLRYFTVLCHQQWPSEINIQRIVKSPVLFLSGAKDELVPPSHMTKLFELCGTRENKDWVEFENGTHNDTCMQSGYFAAIREFLETRILKNEKPMEDKQELDEEIVEQELESTAESNKNAIQQSEGYQLVSGMANDIGLAQSFSIEEVELDE